MMTACYLIVTFFFISSVFTSKHVSLSSNTALIDCGLSHYLYGSTKSLERLFCLYGLAFRRAVHQYLSLNVNMNEIHEQGNAFF